MRSLGKAFLVIVSVVYPCLVFFGLAVFKVSPRILSLCVVLVVAGNFLSLTGKRRDASGAGKPDLAKISLTAVLCLLAALIMVFNSGFFLKLYPLVMGSFLLGTFAFTLVRPPSMILRFATLQDKDLANKEDYPGVERYCRTVTLVWCGFFVLNLCASAYTMLFLSDFAWSLYNGLISYVLIGILFFGEMVFRRFMQRK